MTLRHIVYGVSRMTRNPKDYGRPFKLWPWMPRYYGWARDIFSSDGAYRVARPSLSRYVAYRRGQRLGRQWSKYAASAEPKVSPPSGYDPEEAQR